MVMNALHKNYNNRCELQWKAERCCKFLFCLWDGILADVM